MALWTRQRSPSCTALEMLKLALEKCVNYIVIYFLLSSYFSLNAG